MAAAGLALSSAVLSSPADPAQKLEANAPVVTKVEPPSWWAHLTPEVMLLLSGHDLEATRVVCNLPSLLVSAPKRQLLAATCSFG